MEIDELSVKITGDSTSLQAAMSQAVDAMGKLGIGTSALTGLLGAAGLAGAFKIAYDAASKMVQAFRDDETAQLKYNAALAASVAITAQGKKALDDYVPVFASLSGIAEADTQAQIARLAAYGRTDAQIKTMMQTALGMATVLDMDVNTALTQLNMTFQGTAGRLGQQIAGIKDLTAEQLKNGAGVKLLNEKYGEFSGTLKNSTDVSIKNFENAYSDLMSAMGQSIADTLVPVRDALTATFKWIIDNRAAVTTALNAVELGFASIVAAINPIAGGIALAMVGALKLVELFRASTTEMNREVKNLIALYASIEDPIQKRIRLEKEAAERTRQEAEATAANAAAEAQKAADAQIKSRKETEEAYRLELAATDTRIKEGLLTEQEATDAKYAANKKLIDDLIALGYTGDAESKQIGDKTLREALDRLKEYNSVALELVQQTIEDIKRQEADVAEWEADYLGGVAFHNLMASAEQAIQEADVADWEAAYLGKLAFAALMEKAEQAIQEQDVAEWEADYLGAKAFSELMDKATQAIQDQEVADWESEYLGKVAFSELMANAEKAIQEADVAEWEADYLGKQAFAEIMAKAEEAIQQADVADWEAEYLGQKAFDELMAKATQAIQEEDVSEWEADYLGKIAFEELMSNAEKALQEVEVSDWEADYLGALAFKELMSKAERAIQEADVSEWEAAYLGKESFNALMQKAEEALQESEVSEWEADYLGKQAFTALMAKAEETIQAQDTADWEADYLGARAFNELMQKATDAIQEQDVSEWESDYLGKQAFDALMANAEEAIQQQEVEEWGKQYKLLQSKKLLALTENEYKLTMVQGSESEKRIAKIKAQLAIDLDANKNNEELKAALIKKASEDIEKIKKQELINYASTFLNFASQMLSGFNSLISYQADAAVDAVEKRLKALKKSYGDTASELQTIYDAIEKMGATEKAATIKAQLDKEKAIEDYTSLTMDQLANLYATAIELGDTQTAAEITAAMARVKAEKDAADQIKQIKYDAAVAEWNIRLMATTASAAQAVMDAYSSLISIPVVGPVLAPIAAGVAAGVGIVQIAAVAEAKPKLDTGGVVRARDDTSVTVGRGTGEVLLGTSALGDPLVNGIADKIAARIGGQPIVVRLVCDGKTLAEVTAERFNNGQVRLKR